MENGNDVVGESYVGEKKSVEGRIPEEKMEERVLAGFDESKEMEEDVFEEAIGTQEHLQEKGTKSELGNDGLVVGSSALVVDDENPKARNETEDFEEAIGGPGEDGNAEEVTVVSADEKTENLVLQDGASGVVLPDKIDEGGTEIEADTNELYVEKGVPEIGVHGDTEVLKTRDETDVKSVLIEKAENDDFVSSLLERTPVNKNPDSEDGDVVVGSDLVSHVEVELDGEVLLEDGKTKKLNEDTLVTEHGDVSGGESDDGSNGTHSEPQSDNGEELNNELAKVDAKHKGKEFGQLECATVNLDSEDVDDKSKEVRGTLDGINVEHQVNQSNDVRDPSAESQTTVDELTGARGTGSSTSLEKSTAEQNGELQTVTIDSEVGNYVSSGPASAGEKVNEAHNHRAVGEEPEKIEEKDLEKKPSTQVNRESENMPAPDCASSSAKSVNPAPPARPAGLGRAAPLLEPGPRVAQQPRVNGTVSHTQTQQIEEPATGEADENDETREKLQMIRVKFLRLAHRLGQTPHNVVVAQVLYRLGLAEQLRGRNGGRVGAFSFDRASAMAEQLEAAGQEPLDFSCTIMVLGKTGVGKSATINSIFDEVKFSTDAFQMGTKKVQDVVGTVQGIKVRVIDTPGLLPSWSEQHQNEKILHSVKRFIKKTPPDIVLYLDRLDMQSRDFGDMPLLRTITEIFGPSIWFNAIVVLTHAASAPPDGPNGTASSYDMFVTQRSHVVQQAIRQAAGDMRLMNPVSLVENHSACRTNRAGQRVLPNGQVWKPHLLLLSFASKILAEANALLKLQDSPPGKPFAARSRAPPLPFLLSSLLQSRPQVKLPEEQFGDEDDMDEDLDESSDSDDESEYDQLPPFKRLTKAQMSKLTKAQKKEYLNELEYREKLFMKKQLKEERKRQKMMKKMAAMTKDLPSDYGENVEDETGGAASVPVPMPDLALPASFDSDNPTHRYRYLDSSNQWLVRPVLETHGWDHDVGYEGINVERVFAIKDKVPVSFSGQVTKDKKDANVQMELASSIKHGEGKATSLGFDMQTVGKDLAYTLRSEMRLSNLRKNKATAGLSVTLLGDALSAGVKVEDKLIANKQFRLVVTGGAMAGRGDVAYGGSLEAQLRDKDYPLGRFLSTLGLSVMDWHGDLAIGGNMQSQVPIGRSMNLIARANLNNRGAGQVSIRLNSSEHLQIAYLGLLPLLRKLLGYSQQMQFGQ